MHHISLAAAVFASLMSGAVLACDLHATGHDNLGMAPNATQMPQVVQQTAAKPTVTAATKAPANAKPPKSVATQTAKQPVQLVKRTGSTGG